MTGTSWTAPHWRDVFNINTTGLRWADAILTGEPEALLHYGVTGRLVWMSPDAYCVMQAEAKGQPVAVDLSKVDQAKVDNYANMMRIGAAHFPVCMTRPGGQDGRHRALAAKQVGIKTIPVFVMSRLSAKEAAALIPKDCVLRYEPGAPNWVQVNTEAAKRERDHKFPMGKNGNIMVGYEKPPVTTLVKCDKCGRPLTTKYWVWDKARQEIIVVGAEHLPEAMGRFRLLPKKLRYWERKLTKLQELAQVEKSLKGSEKPGHKWVKRSRTPSGKWRYTYQQQIDSDDTLYENYTAIDVPTAQTIHQTIQNEAKVGGKLALRRVLHQNHVGGSRVLFWSTGTQLGYTDSAIAPIVLRVIKDSLSDWLPKISNQLQQYAHDGNTQAAVRLSHIQQVLLARGRLGLERLPALTLYLDRADCDMHDRQEIVRRAITHELGHVRWLFGAGADGQYEFKKLVQNVDVAAQLPSYYAMESVEEAFAQCFAVHRLSLQLSGKPALPSVLKEFFDKRFPGSY